jgi:uncharacterized protein
MVDALDHRKKPSQRVRQVLENSGDVLVTTEACLTEAMYLVGSRIGWAAQSDLWRLLEVAEVSVLPANLSLVRRLMTRYQDVPMDFADATLVALASEERTLRIATFDDDFVAYRRDDGSPVPLLDDRLLGWE